MNQRDFDAQGQNDFFISYATAEDAPGCHAVDASFGPGFETNDAVFQRAIERQQLIVARDEHGQVVGYVHWGHFWDDALPYLQTVRVIESHQRRGIGRRLVSKLVDDLKQRGARNLLSSVDEDNIDALDFLDALGFKDCGYVQLPDHYRENLFLKRLRRS